MCYFVQNSGFPLSVSPELRKHPLPELNKERLPQQQLAEVYTACRRSWQMPATSRDHPEDQNKELSPSENTGKCLFRFFGRRFVNFKDNLTRMYTQLPRTIIYHPVKGISSIYFSF